MKINKKYIYTNNRQLFRLLISESNKLIVEDRDIEKKQAYFNCLDAASGRDIFRNLQLEEKFWIGIEAVYKDVIYFHKYAKPDMPGHKEIIAFDISQQKILWHSDSVLFLFMHDDRMYGFRQKFETREFYALDYLSGELVEELGNDPEGINLIRDSIDEEAQYRDYLFPNTYFPDKIHDIEIKVIIDKFTVGLNIEGNVEFVRYGNVLLFNYYERLSDRTLVNRFLAADLHTQELIYDEVLNSGANSFVPDSFFMKHNLVFILKEKKEIIVSEIV
ncbi:MAG: DUF4905 domain-containing protein [Ignavibacteriales bacterium]